MSRYGALDEAPCKVTGGKLKLPLPPSLLPESSTSTNLRMSMQMPSKPVAKNAIANTTSAQIARMATTSVDAMVSVVGAGTDLPRCAADAVTESFHEKVSGCDSGELNHKL